MHTSTTSTTRPATGRGSAVARRSVAVAALAAAAFTMAGSDAEAKMTGEAIVECNGSYDTMTVTPRVVSDHADQAQWTATRVWIARWNGSTWAWSAKPWKVELAKASNSPMGHDISRLEAQQFQLGNGYYYVYVESYMWNGTSWYGQTGKYTTTYTQITPSVSHEPSTRTSATYCSL